ncbi:5-oxoprolinase subunit PxpB [Photobacterium leiognathi]|uniref:5-oxoprolinase subunit PxpB n=1 Tax=Photobacterium leiognathi TaxID=553611 RepID=UPI002735FF54|nr:5-oxoprolinase subunit PxpB [Photobacterium leiognathi]
MKISPLTENAFMVEFGQEICSETTLTISEFVAFFKSSFQHDCIDITPSYTKVMVQYRPRPNLYPKMIAAIELWHVDQQSNLTEHCGVKRKLHKLPVYYHHDVAPDLSVVAKVKGLTEQQVIAHHCNKTYDVGAIGFTAGFAFLSSVDDEITIPRHASPRLQIPAGSVGIADQQTAIYPDQSPGGWHIIGNCPQSLFVEDRYPLSIFSIGDRVQFVSITRDAFFDLGGRLWQR